MPGDIIAGATGLSASGAWPKRFSKTLGQKPSTLDGNARMLASIASSRTIRCMAALFSSPWSLRVEEPQTISGPELINILTTPLDQTSQLPWQASPFFDASVAKVFDKRHSERKCLQNNQTCRLQDNQTAACRTTKPASCRTTAAAIISSAAPPPSSPSFMVTAAPAGLFVDG